MTVAFTLTEAERARIARLDAFVALGTHGVGPLLAALDDPSWTVRRAAVASLAALGDDAVSDLCEWLRSERTSERAIAAAVDALVAARGSQIVGDVLGLLDATVPAVVADAAVILGRRRAAEASGALVPLLDAADGNVAVAAIEALGAIGGSVAFDALARVLERREFFRTFPAMQVLSASGDPRAVQVIRPLLQDPLFRDEAISALGRTGSPQAVAPLAELLDSAPLVTVASALAEVVARSAFAGAAAHVGAELRARLSGASTRFTTALAMADGEHRRAIAGLLGWIGDATAIPALGALLGDAANAPSAMHAIQQIAVRDPSAIERLLDLDDPAARAAALGMVTRRDAAPAVRALLDADDPEQRALACAALARLGDTASVPELFDALADTNPLVAHSAAAAINSLGSAETAEHATRAVRSASAAVRRHALRIFGYLGLPGAFEAAHGALADTDVKVIEVAISILGTLDDPRADGLLGELAVASDEQLRVAATRAAAHRSSDAMYALLQHALTDASAWVRYHACHGIGRQWRGGSPANVIARLTDPQPQVRLAAIEALALMRTPEAWQALCAAAASDDPDQQRAALAGLGLHDREAAVDLLVAGTASADAATRVVALSALAPARSPRALEALVAAARDPSRDLREVAVTLLAERDDRAAADALVVLAIEAPAGDPAHLALSRAGAARIAAIAKRLADPQPTGASTLASALARMHSRDAMDALAQALEASDPVVRRTAAALLVATGAPDAFAKIARLATHDPDPEVRRVCATLIGK